MNGDLHAGFFLLLIPPAWILLGCICVAVIDLNNFGLNILLRFPVAECFNITDESET
jgi:hypothetical protein